MEDEIKETINILYEFATNINSDYIYDAQGFDYPLISDCIEELLDYITNLQEELKYSIPQVQHNQIVSKLAEEKHILQEENKNLKQINEEHRKINGELRKTINEAVEYIKETGCYENDTETFCDDIANYELYDLLNILQGK